MFTCSLFSIPDTEHLVSHTKRRYIFCMDNKMTFKNGEPLYSYGFEIIRQSVIWIIISHKCPLPVSMFLCSWRRHISLSMLPGVFSMKSLLLHLRPHLATF